MTDIFLNNLQFSFKLNTLLFPLDIEGFEIKLDELKYKRVQKGYVTPDGLPSKKGDIIVKGNTFINMNIQSQVVTLSSISVKEILDVFKEIKNPLKISGLDVEKDVRAYSSVVLYHVNTGNNAFEKIGKFMGSNDAVQSISSVLGMDSQQYAINLISKDRHILDDNFYQIQIEPYIQRLGKVYLIQYSQRDSDKNVIIEKLEKLENNVRNIIKMIES
ncbi:MAG: hypothetical protein IIC67_01300 [Thaumarchaeota archaeon]|nr:hypothetical protein [Nitrososphaerota archaeon]